MESTKPHQDRTVLHEKKDDAYPPVQQARFTYAA